MEDYFQDAEVVDPEEEDRDDDGNSYPEENMGTQKRKRVPVDDTDQDQQDVQTWDNLTDEQQLQIMAVDEHLAAFKRRRAESPAAADGMEDQEDHIQDSEGADPEEEDRYDDGNCNDWGRQ